MQLTASIMILSSEGEGGGREKVSLLVWEVEEENKNGVFEEEATEEMLLSFLSLRPRALIETASGWWEKKLQERENIVSLWIT